MHKNKHLNTRNTGEQAGGEFFRHAKLASSRKVDWSSIQNVRRITSEGEELARSILDWLKQANFRTENLRTRDFSDKRFMGEAAAIAEDLSSDYSAAHTRIFQINNKLFVISSLHGEICYMAGHISKIHELDDVSIIFLKNAESRQYPEINVFNVEADSNIWVVVDLDFYLNAAANMYAVYEERAEQGLSIKGSFSDIHRNTSYLLAKGIGNILKSWNTDLITGLTLAMLNCEIAHSIFLSNIRLADKQAKVDNLSITELGLLFKMAYGSPFLTLASVYGLALIENEYVNPEHRDACTGVLIRLVSIDCVTYGFGIRAEEQELAEKTQMLLSAELAHRLGPESDKIAIPRFSLTAEDIGAYAE